MDKCVKCNQPLEEGLTKCPNCGELIKDDAKSVKETIEDIRNLKDFDERAERFISQTDIYSKNMEIVSTISGAIVDTVDENYAVIYSDSEKIYINKNGEIVSNKEVYPENKIYSTNVFINNITNCK